MRQKRETTSARVVRTPTRHSTSMARVLTSAASATSCCKRPQPRLRVLCSAVDCAGYPGVHAYRSTSAGGVEGDSTHSTAIDAHGARLQRRTECSGGRGGQERAHVRRAMRARRCAPRAAPAPTGRQCRKGPLRSAAGVPRPNPQRTGLVCRERDAAAGRPPHLLARKLGRRGRRGILALEQPRLERKLLLLKDRTAAVPIGNRSRRRSAKLS